MKINKIKNSGMTLPELILAILMLTSFTGIAVMVTEYTGRFFQPLNESAKKDSSDMLSANFKINNTLDSIIDFLSEPGIDKNVIKTMTQECTQTPSIDWGIPSIDRIPRGYTICIKTAILESDYLKLANGDGNPGIYILYSKPITGGVSVSATPIRRIFCRPKPFCKS